MHVIPAAAAHEDIQLQRANRRKWLKMVTEEQRQGN